MPERHEVKVAYDDTFNERHEEVFVLDWAVFKDRMFTTEKTVHHVAKAVAEINTTLQRWAQRQDIVKVATYDGEQYDQRLAAEQAQLRQQYEDHLARRQPQCQSEDQQ